MGQRNVAFPFLTIPDELIDASSWLVALDGEEPVADALFLQGWDYNSNIRVEREIRLAPGKILEALRLDRSCLRLMTRWGTGEGNKPTLIHRLHDQPIPGGSPDDIQVLTVRGNIPGRDLAGRLFLEIFIILDVEINSRQTPLAPSHKGSVLWHDALAIALEGGANRFPVSSSPLPEDLAGSLWYLDFDPAAVDEPFLSSVRLHLNSRRKDFMQRIERGDPLLEQAMMADVVAQLVTSALSDDERLQQIMQMDDASTLGHQMRRWIVEIFETPEVALEELRHRPGSFHARINAAFSMAEEGK